MSQVSFSKIAPKPNWEGFLRCIKRQGTPDRVYNIELFLDAEVQTAVCARYPEILKGLDPADPAYPYRRQIALQRFLGYDFVRAGVEGYEMPLHRIKTEDTAALARAGGRNFQDEHRGPVATWAEFEAYPWPKLEQLTTPALEWYERNLPDDMCIIGGLVSHFAEYINWLMGYETLCYALYEQRDLVQAIADKIAALNHEMVRLLLQFSRVKIVWGSDDMGFRSGPLISPKDMREFVLPGHKAAAAMAHAAGKPYILHSCGNLTTIMDDLINDVQIDGKHSFEDTIESVIEDKKSYGRQIALLGGIDVDFLCRASEAQIRERVRQTLEACQPGGGYCLGTGNSVANYIPLDNYLAMLDEGRKF
jgi:uroporphyrinogen decarboxylase